MFNRWKLVMKSSLLALGFAGLLTIGVRPVAGQMNAPAMQGSSHSAVSHGAARSMAAAPQNFSRRPLAVGLGVINSRPIGMSGLSGMNPRLNYSPFARSLNPTLAAMRSRPNARSYYPQPTRGLLARNEFAPTKLPFANSVTGGVRDYGVQPSAEMLA